MNLERGEIKALLTLDWEPPEGSVPATNVAGLSPITTDAPLVLANCESLFERHPKGYDPLKELEKTLPKLQEANPDAKFICHFNAFAYAFLKGAKNYDFLFPELA